MLHEVLVRLDSVDGVRHALAKLEVVRTTTFASPTLQSLGAHAPTGGQVCFRENHALGWKRFMSWGAQR